MMVTMEMMDAIHVGTVKCSGPPDVASQWTHYYLNWTKYRQALRVQTPDEDLPSGPFNNVAWQPLHQRVHHLSQDSSSQS